MKLFAEICVRVLIWHFAFFGIVDCLIRVRYDKDVATLTGGVTERSRKRTIIRLGTRYGLSPVGYAISEAEGPWRDELERTVGEDKDAALRTRAGMDHFARMSLATSAAALAGMTLLAFLRPLPVSEVGLVTLTSSLSLGLNYFRNF